MSTTFGCLTLARRSLCRVVFSRDKRHLRLQFREATSIASRYTFSIPMATKLEEIVAAARSRVAAAKATADVRALNIGAERHQPRGFRRALQERAASGVAVIAELKKASPSKGVIREDFRVADLACELERAGAAALSVLTDEKYFQGSLQNLVTASEKTKLPCLRKGLHRRRSADHRGACAWRRCGSADRCGIEPAGVDQPGSVRTRDWP